VYRQEFYIVVKKDDDIESPNYHKLLSLRNNRSGSYSKKDIWTDNIFLAKHFAKESDATTYASQQLNMEFIACKSEIPEFNDSGYRLAKVYMDIDANSEISSILYTQ